MNTGFMRSAGTKRSREDDGDADFPGKKARPTVDNGSGAEQWPQDSVISTPSASSHHPKYDSDDQSSMMSEPGSPQNAASSSGDDMDMDEPPSYSQSPEEQQPLPKSTPASSSPRRDRMQARNRIPTPFHKPTMRPGQLQTGSIKQHVRQRHPQENSSDHLEVPSPIDEDEVPTPPSAAEAAGSQLSMLSMDDMDVEVPGVPTITVDPARNAPANGEANPGVEAVDGGSEQIIVRKQRQRSGAQSSGSTPPGRVTPALANENGFGRRGIAVGYRADCEKCRMRVPGHMNHFVS